jgi:hypothetical protein
MTDTSANQDDHNLCYAFSSQWERLHDPARRLGLPNTQWLVVRARDLKHRGLIESRYKSGYLEYRLTANGMAILKP